MLLAPGARGETRVHYDDLTTSGRLRGPAGVPLLRAAACGDELRQAMVLRAGQAVSASLEVRPGATLVVAGCARGSQAPGKRRPRVEIRFEPEAPAESAIVQEVPIARTGSWWRRSFDWSGLSGRRGRLVLRAVLPDGAVFLLRELHLRYEETAAPAPPEAATAAAVAPPQILLISIDTLRADAIAALGGSGPTPALDRLVGESQVWTHHYAAASWTKPSHASLLTGVSPVVHGATSFPGAIHPRVRTLAQRFRAAGFDTAGLVYQCIVLDARFGFGRGFDDYRAVFWELPQQARAALDWMGARRERPFFYFLHTYEVHSDSQRLPYEGPGVRQRTVQRHFGIEGYGCEGKLCATERLAKIGKGELAPLPEEDRILRFLYQRGVQYVDRSLGRLFDDLRAMGMFDRMLIVVTSDHGEAFLEHANTLHGGHWNEVLRVPLLIKWPGGRFAGARNPLNTSSLDLAPTLLAAAAIETAGLPGRNLATAREDAPVFAHVPVPVVVSGRYKAVFEAGAQGPLLFDLESDPGEERDLAAERPERAAVLRSLTEERLRSDRRLGRELAAEEPAGVAPSLSEEEQQRLRALGYAVEP